MTKEIADKLKSMINYFSNKDANFPRQPDFDEIKILHSRTKEHFPQEFNDLVARMEYSLSNDNNRNLFQRLARILEVIDSLPTELKHVQERGSPTSTTLVPMFELKKPDKERIFELCTAMRKIVFVTVDFDQPHQLRLLNRIAAIEAETQKDKGIFDVVRGGLNDLGETLGKFGKDIKPLTDRMAEVVSIARKGTKEYDQLPPPEDVKRLPAPTEDEES